LLRNIQASANASAEAQRKYEAGKKVLKITEEGAAD